MDAKTMRGITQQVARQFPEVAGVKPMVRPQAGAKGTGGNGTYLVTYKGRVTLPGGPSFPRMVRVVTDEAGRILKITTSR